LAFFQSLRALFTGSGPAAVTNDLSFGLIDALAVKPMLEQKQWQAFEKVAIELASDELTRLLDGLCLSDYYAPLLERYQKSGTSELRRLVAAVHATFRAWEARSGAYARELSQQQIDGFSHYLGQAHAQLMQPFATPVLQAQAAARLVRVAMGLGDPELARAAYEQCVAMQPTNLLAHIFYFNVLTPKWFGDEETLEDFVDEASDPNLHSLLQAMYLVELQFIVDEETTIVKQEMRSKNQHRINELLTKNPRIDDTLPSIYFNNYVACLSENLEQTAIRNQFLQALGNRITIYPWAYFGLTPQAVRNFNPSVS
jgi:hypothetical protein